MDIIIREAVPDDADGLAHVIITSTQTAFVGLVPEICLNGLTEEESAANWKRTLTQGLDADEFLVVACDKSDIVILS